MACRIASRCAYIVALVMLVGCTCSNDLVTPREVDPTTRALLRIVHASSSTGEVSCYQNDKYFAGQITYSGVIRPAAPLPNEVRNLRFVSTTGQPLLSLNVNLLADVRYTFVLFDRVDRLRGILLHDDPPTPAAGTSIVRLVHADIHHTVITMPTIGDTVSVPFSLDSGWRSIPSGTDLVVRIDGVQATIPASLLPAERATTVIVRDEDGPGTRLLAVSHP